MRDWRRARTISISPRIRDNKRPTETRGRKLRFESLESRHLLATTIDVFAAGKTGEENVALEISGVQVAEWDAIGGDYSGRIFQRLSYVSPDSVSIDQIQVRFTNNSERGAPVNRNLRVDGVRIDGVKHESEAPSVLSTGTYVPGVGCVPHYAESEFLHCNGYLRFGPPGSAIHVHAAGKTHEEQIALEIGGVRVATYENMGGNYKQERYKAYTYLSDTDVGLDQIRVIFLNDGLTSSGENKNVRIDGVKLDGELYESEDPSVLSTGTYVPGVGCVPHYAESEFLHCNGFLQFGPPGSAIHVHAAGASGEENIALRIGGTRVALFEGIAGRYPEGRYKAYTYLSDTDVDIDQIRVVFTNGSPAPGGEDRSLRVGAVKLDGELFESEAPNVLSTGTLIAGIGCQPGYWQSEFLNCLGSFDYGGNPNIGTLSLGGSNFSVNEDAGTIAIPIVRTGGSDGTVSLDVTTVDATAVAGSDYTAQSQTVVFAPGRTRRNVVVPITDDSRDETNETFSLSADRVAGGAALGQPRTGLITIIDDEGPPPPGNGNGLLGQYFDRLDFVDIAFERTDPRVDFDWKDGSPDPSMLDDTFSIRWIGEVQPLYTEKYTFHTTTDDGVRLWVGGQRLVGAWVDQVATEHSGEIELQAGQRYRINMEYYERTLDASARLEWESPSQPRQVIPQSQLYSELPSPLGDNLYPETVVSGLTQPMAIDFAAGGRMFIASKSGRVQIYENGQLLADPFISISREVNNVRDRGLLGMAVHPQFPVVPYVYLLYVYDPPETAGQPDLAGPNAAGNRVARLTRVTANPATNYNTALPGSEVVILGKNSTWDNISRPDLDSTNDANVPPSCPIDGTGNDCIPVDSQSHAPGAVVFGNDGSLFVSVGDGTGYGHVDPRTIRVQDLDSLSGKLLRIDPITGIGLSDNPFFDGDPNSNRSKVYSYGLRNPFRFAIDPVSGEPYIGDVGWTTWEEINYGRGANFGWPFYEGGNGQSLETGGYRDLPEAQAFYASNPDVTAPAWSRLHSDGGTAIVAGDFYTGSLYSSALRNTLFFTDFGEPTIRALKLAPDGSVSSSYSVMPGFGTLVEMSMGSDGLMYYVDMNGAVGRIAVVGGGGSAAAVGQGSGELPSDFTPTAEIVGAFTAGAAREVGRGRLEQIGDDLGNPAGASNRFQTRSIARQVQTDDVNSASRRDAFALFSHAPARDLPKEIEPHLELRSHREKALEKTWGESRGDDVDTINRWSSAVKAALSEIER